MKKNIVHLFTVLFIAGIFIIGCDTKDDPPVPNHIITKTSSTGSTGVTSSNILNFAGIDYSLDSIISDTNPDLNQFIIAGKKPGQIVVGIVLGGGKPTTSGTYTIALSGPENAGPGEAGIVIAQASGESWGCVQGSVNVSVSGGFISASFSNLTFYNTSMQTQTASCNIRCPQ
jgi:hypothetical protein